MTFPAFSSSHWYMNPISRRTTFFLLGAITGSAATYLLNRRSSVKSAATQTAEPTSANRVSELVKYGIPETEQVQFRKNFVTSINYRMKIPNWVLEHLTKENLKGTADRQYARFEPDESVPEIFRANNEDYWKSGYSRGHLAPASNNKSSAEAMKESFLLSANIVPQDYDNNVWYWNRLELYVRDLTNYFDDVYTLTGPLWLPEPIPDPTDRARNASPSSTSMAAHARPKRMQRAFTPPPPPLDALPLPAGEDVLINPVPSTIFHAAVQHPDDVPMEPTDQLQPVRSLTVRPLPAETAPPRPLPKYQICYPVLGDTQIAIPSHLFKAILATDTSTHTHHFAAFVIPNRPIPEDTPLKVFQVGKNDLEKMTGFKVFEGGLGPQGELKDLCISHGCRMMEPDEHRLYFLTRDLRNSKKMQRVERTVDQLLRQGIVPDHEFMKVLAEKVDMLDRTEQEVGEPSS
ncbi:uncharacterized protein SPPG_07640 [Spizellomyces punctatus DAOM BR117]|uniref:Uncharacterized protein n=1 Tax=Spizellomyces punctatus (strain DAOM BR117) TaxID=645134 RepID=A0A0L0H9B6_SPIPD|nr:uncharacterized protein SPPG_07640 [Spizellomyces punctatus DAOM BR117]KNC97253.1 hypothetical protein SPPG_07640 [Spizellomyces punctatus DAOM BR117]|eukprot:XP_016605293.1 hypothetical protein SPPG_07640 [Spizellomyces punctatus DAOM BR117]